MANPAKLTVTALAVNSSLERPAGDAIDTNGTVPIVVADMLGAPGRLLFDITEDNVRELTVTFDHGDNPPAVREGLGSLEIAQAQNTVRIIGPIDPSQFVQDDGTINVTFAGTAGAATCHVRTYLLPKL